MIPIFIITCDRLNVLKESMQSFHDYIKTLFEIVIIDLGSTYKPTVEFLRGLEHGEVMVYWGGRIKHPRDLNFHVSYTIQDYFKSHPACNYVVTDPDIALDNVDRDILDVYNYLLEILPRITVVGPMLRIDDIPDCYHNKEKVQIRHFREFWSKEINNIKYKNKVIRYISTKIDTTFGMYKEGSQWHRLQNGVRVFAPYSARHLDWYLNSKNLTPDQKHYVEYASKAITHWSMGNY